MTFNVKRAFWTSFLVTFLFFGCQVPILSVTPSPCQRISEVPGLPGELETLKRIDDELQKHGMVKMTENVRKYVVEADVKCAYDRELGR